MSINPLLRKIRTKKVGLLIRDARQIKGLSLAACAQAIGVSEATLQAFELGEISPSLPDLEALAFIFELPVDHFRGDQLLAVDGRKRAALGKLRVLRQRVIGVLLRQARLRIGLSTDELARQVNLTTDQVQAYELGQAAIPLPELEALAEALNCPFASFEDQQGPIGAWRVKVREQEEFHELRPELKTFVLDPKNRSYLEMAKQLSEIPADNLQAVGESLLIVARS